MFHAGIRLSFGLAQDQLTMVNNHILSDFKTQFNRDQYLAELKMQLNQKINFNLQALKRVVIIGSKTRGGANAGRTFRINEHFEIYIPVGKAINPITGKNWEGGIIPDIVTASKEALRKAQIVALQKLIDIAESPQKKQQLQSFLNEIPTN